MPDIGGVWFFHIYYDNKLDKPLKIYNSCTLIDSFAIDGYTCKTGLFFSEERELYFIGEAKNVDYESPIVKVDFDTDQISKLTNHGEDKYINDLAFYEF